MVLKSGYKRAVLIRNAFPISMSLIIMLSLVSIVVALIGIPADMLGSSSAVEKVVQTGVSFPIPSTDSSHRISVIGKIHDTNSDGRKEFLSYEGDKVALRDGESGATLNSFAIPAGTQISAMGSLGKDLTGDNKPEFFIAYAFSESAKERGQGVDVFDGASQTKIFSFPEVVKKVEEQRAKCSQGWVAQDDPINYYPFPVNSSGFSATAMQNDLDGNARILIGAPDANMAIVLSPQKLSQWSPTCSMQNSTNPDTPEAQVEVCSCEKPYDVIRPVRQASVCNSQSNDTCLKSFGGNSIALFENGEVAKILISDHNMNFKNLVGQYNENAGGLFVFSSRDFGQYSLLSPGFENGRFAFNLANIGDVNADGIDDFAVSSPGGTHDEYFGGAASVYSGRNLNAIDFSSGDLDSIGAEFGYSIDGGEDLDEDGVIDHAISAPFLNGVGSVRVISGKNGKSLYTLDGSEAEQGYGASVALLAASRLLVADTFGNLIFIKLGADLTGPQSKPDGIPDWCATPTIITDPDWPAEVKSAILKLKSYVKSAKGKMVLLNMATANRSDVKYDEATKTNLRSLEKTVLLISKTIKNTPTLAMVHAKLTSKAANDLSSSTSSYLKLFSDYRKAKRQSEKKKIKANIVKEWRQLNRMLNNMQAQVNTKKK